MHCGTKKRMKKKHGGVIKVDGIMDGNKSARREYGYGGRVSYKDGGYSKAMKKAKPC